MIAFKGRERAAIPLVQPRAADVKAPQPFSKEAFVQRDYLRYVHHGFLRQARILRAATHISPSGGEAEIRGNHNHDYRPNAAFVEFVRLDYQHRSPISGSGTGPEAAGTPTIASSSLGMTAWGSFSAALSLGGTTSPGTYRGHRRIGRSCPRRGSGRG